MKIILNTLALLFAIVSAVAQTGTVTGKVYDNYNNPLAGVNVVLEGTNKGTTTNENGSFELKNVSLNKNVVISYLGFKTKEFVITSSKDLGAITLYEGNEVLQEVIIETSRKNKFSRKESAYVAKMPLKNIDNPQVYNTVTNQLIESQSIVTLDEALKNTAGVTKLWNATGRSNDGAAYFSSRGFAVQPKLVDGIAGFTNSFINASNIERIEVIKGPTGTLFGTAVSGYGGLINIVTKKPYKGTGGNVSVAYGSNNFKKVTFDINASDQSDKFSVRFNAGYQDEDSFQDAGLKQTFFMAPSISYEVSKDVTFNLSYETNVTKQTNGTSIFFNRSVPLHYSSLEELNYNPELSFTDDSVTLVNPNQSYRGELVWEISDNWTSQSIFGGSDSRSTGTYTYLWDQATWAETSPGVWNAVSSNEYFDLYAQDMDSQTKAFNVQQNFTGDFKIGQFRNKLLVGADYLTKKIIDNGSGWPYVNTFLIDGTLPFGGLALNEGAVQKALRGSSYSNEEIHTDIFGAYISNVFEVSPKLSLSAGVRLDLFDYNGDINTDEDDYKEYFKKKLSPKFGVVFQPILNKLSVFANYQNGFSYQDPQKSLTGETISFDIIKANQLEFGVKGSLFNNKLEGTLSFYNIDVDNLYSWVSESQDQKVNSKGIELELNASPIDGLNIHSGFSHNISEIKELESYTDFEGLRYQSSGPATTYNLWADYKFLDGALKNFGLGAGFNGASEYDTMVGYQPITGSFMLPGYTVFNASIYSENSKFRVGIKANNLSDLEYYSGWSTVTPEQPRTFLGTFTYKF